MQKAIIVGCGRSVRPDGFDPPDGVETFGLNDSSRWCSRIDQNVVIDSPGRFKGERLEAIANIKCKHFWNYTPDWYSVRRDAGFGDDGKPDIFIVEWQQWDKKELDTGPIVGILTSLVPALVIAYRWGARDIAVIGCDLVGHHQLTDQAVKINQVLKYLRGRLIDAGVRDVVNLAERNSRLTALPKVRLNSWLELDL